MKVIFSRGIFVDLQKTFDTVVHNILKKLLHYGVRVISSKWFESYLTGRKQSVSISSDILTITCCTLKGQYQDHYFLYIHK